VVDIDVTDEGSVQAAIAAVLASSGGVDAVVNNAGRGAIGALEAFSQAQVEALFDLNVFGALRVNRAVLPSMRARNSGLLVHVSSAIGRVMPKVGGLYATTKWALEGLAESLHYEVAAFGIDVAIVEPGAFPSPAMSKAMVADNAAVGQAYAAAAAAVNPPMDQPPPADYNAAYEAASRRLAAALRRPDHDHLGPAIHGGVAYGTTVATRAVR
jgi:NAD(P)-dependent dehydrogenase (short-subunit alcohol dehydrogenase family)